MALAAGTRLGPYEILAPIGAGGMGEVYRARDTRLKRDVAIKVCAERFNERFEREARTIAALSHPNICMLHDVGPTYLVMELLEGETLAARLRKGALPTDVTVRYGAEVADALAAAHAKGIIHRDLKPANVMVTKKGVKVLDFGLAKSESDETLTATNAVMGTPRYMAPEQLEGKECDARTDIYALGLMLHEMATGQKPAKERVSVEPVGLDRLIAACLAVDPNERMQTARDLRTALTLVLEKQPIVKERKAAPWPWIAIAIAASLAALTIGVIHLREKPPALSTLRYTIPAPENTTNFHSFAISPNGRYVAIAAESGGKRQLWLRALDAQQSQQIPGTEGAAYPFWSPDNRYIGFFAQNKLKKIAVNGGPAQSLCAAYNGVGGSWNRDNLIVFSPGAGTVPIQTVSASGGVPSDVTKTKGEAQFPVFLPDNRHFLYLVLDLSPEENGVYLSSVDGKEGRRVLPDTSTVAVTGGRLLFIRENTLVAQPFDFASGQTTGDASPVAAGVTLAIRDTVRNYAPVSVSETGVLLYLSAGAARATSQIAWYDRGGRLLEAIGAPGRVGNPAISPDGKSLVYSREDPESNLWMRDLTRGTEQRFTTGTFTVIAPAWSPDGNSVAFSSTRAGHFDLYRKAANGTGQDELLMATGGCELPSQWSRDGRFLIYTGSCDPKINTLWDIWTLNMSEGGKAGPRTGTLFLRTEFNEWLGQLSPDGNWMSYTSDESGQREIYIRPFPGDGKWKISLDGGDQARWRGDGKELFFVGGDGKMMAVPVEALPGPKPTIQAGTPQRLFETHLVPIQALFEYDVTLDGKRFLLASTIGGPVSPPPLNVVVNWDAGLKK